MREHFVLNLHLILSEFGIVFPTVNIGAQMHATVTACGPGRFDKDAFLLCGY